MEIDEEIGMLFVVTRRIELIVNHKWVWFEVGDIFLVVDSKINNCSWPGGDDPIPVEKTFLHPTFGLCTRYTAKGGFRDWPWESSFTPLYIAGS